MRRFAYAWPATVLVALRLSIGVRSALAGGPPTEEPHEPWPRRAADGPRWRRPWPCCQRRRSASPVIDVMQNRPPVRDHLLTLDAFTVKDNP